MQQTDELFSALLDGELALEEIDALMESLDHNPKSTEAATRWSAIGVMMRGQSRLSARTDLLEGVREAIATEAAEPSKSKVVALASRRRVRRWALPATGLAAAASLAIAAGVVPAAWQAGSPAGTVQEAAPAGGSANVASVVSPLQRGVAQARLEERPAGLRVGNRDSAVLPVGDERLNTYYIEYAGHRSAQGIGGPLGYARYAAHNADLSHRNR
ncbi:MAG: sigma-E factor negative regulatory protein [Proteobacteria bacterium]|nr:sigma-E factor negative regulatory protein [Pseudomonadota bacterium]